jgi:urea transport system substrate-binding protein
MNRGDDLTSEGDPFSTRQYSPTQPSAAGDSKSRSDDSTLGGLSDVEARFIESSHVTVGERIGRYEITGVLGAGGMGVVFKAHYTAIDRTVAIKVLAANIAVNARALDRFLVEARAAGKLSHANAVPVYEIGEQAGIHYLVMEFLPGGSVSARLQRDGLFSAAEATRIAADAARGLAAAHRAGLIHRDMKPANLLVADDGTIKIADFGLAKSVAGVDSRLTAQGQIIGTPYFMSPEQCEARELDHRSDIYSLGATYYALLTGVNPYEDKGSFLRIMHAHCEGKTLNPRAVDPRVPRACAAIVERATAKRPEDRYQSAEDMLAELAAAQASLGGDARAAHPSRAAARRSADGAARRRQRRLILGGIVALAGVLALLAVGRGMRSSPSGSDDAGGGAQASLPIVPPPSGEAIKVGVLHSLTGTMAVSGASTTEATLLAIEEVNASGGVLGRPVEAIVRDSRSDANNFATEAERLITDEHVSVIFGCWTSSGRKMVVPIVENHDALLIYPRLYEGIEESPNVFYLGATPNQQMMPAVKWIFEAQNKRRYFLVGSDYVFPRIANEIIRDQLRELGGEIVGEEYLPLGGDDFQPIVAKIVAAKPDCILNTVSGDSNVAFFHELRAAGIEPADIPTISFSIGEEELQQLEIEKMVGDYAACCYFQSIASAENERFVSGFRKKFGPQRVVTDPMEAAYMSVKLWAAAVKEAGALEIPAVRQVMRGSRLPSPAGELRIDPSTQHAYKTPRIGRILETGQFKIIWTAPAPVAPEPYAASRSAEEWRAVLHDLQRSWNGQWAAPN